MTTPRPRRPRSSDAFPDQLFNIGPALGRRRDRAHPGRDPLRGAGHDRARASSSPSSPSPSSARPSRARAGGSGPTVRSSGPSGVTTAAGAGGGAPAEPGHRRPRRRRSASASPSRCRRGARRRRPARRGRSWGPHRRTRCSRLGALAASSCARWRVRHPCCAAAPCAPSPPCRPRAPARRSACRRWPAPGSTWPAPARGGGVEVGAALGQRRRRRRRDRRRGVARRQLRRPAAHPGALRRALGRLGRRALRGPRQPSWRSSASPDVCGGPSTRPRSSAARTSASATSWRGSTPTSRSRPSPTRCCRCPSTRAGRRPPIARSPLGALTLDDLGLGDRRPVDAEQRRHRSEASR